MDSRLSQPTHTDDIHNIYCPNHNTGHATALAICFLHSEGGKSSSEVWGILF